MKPIGWLTGLLLINLFACKKKDADTAPLPEGQQWIADSMRLYYYWNEQLPVKPAAQSSADLFFRSLLVPADRFSYLDDPSVIKDSYSSFAYYGFEYELITLPQLPGRLVGVITLVVPGSSSAQRGLKRGDCFSVVNNISLEQSTSEQIIDLLKKGQGITFQRIEIAGNTIVNRDRIVIPVAHFREQPVHLTRIFGDAAQKTGYLFYNYFDGAFDKRLLDSIGKLKAAGISELILDMRYNPGGDVSSAAKLAAVLAPVQPAQLFVVYKANRNGGLFKSSFQETMSENNYAPTDFTTVSNYRISLNRVIVLTTSSTASAAELLINNLRPYIPVIQIGTKTMGKDMASFAIDDQRVPKKIPYILHPLVFKLYNAQQRGDYATGLSPDFTADEWETFPLEALGSPADPLIKKALELTGTAPVVAGRQSAATFTTHIYSSAGSRSDASWPVSTKKFRPGSKK